MQYWQVDFMGGARLRRARTIVGLSLTALAAGWNVSDETVRRWEVGETIPQPFYRKDLEAFIHRAERDLARALAPKGQFSKVPVVWTKADGDAA